MDLDEMKKSFIKHKLQSMREYLSKKWVFIKQFSSRYKFQLVLSILIGVSIAIMLIYFVFNKQADFINELGNKDKPFYIRNIAVVLAAIATAVFTWWKNTISHKTTEIQESTRQDELFAKAVDLLKRENDLITRKAGVHILKDLAITSPKHTQKCIDMLCSLNEVWMPQILAEYPAFFECNENFTNVEIIELLKLNVSAADSDSILYLNSDERAILFKDDIAISQLVLLSLSEIFRHISNSVDFQSNCNLQFKYLCGGKFEGIDFFKICNKMPGVRFQGANLTASNFYGVKLMGAVFRGANLQGTKFQYTDLKKVNFMAAILEATNFEFADINEGNFYSTDISLCYFKGAKLRSTNFESAKLMDVEFYTTRMHGAIFQNAELFSVNFDYATLKSVHFEYSQLAGSTLRSTNISYTDFSNAGINQVDFGNSIIEMTNFDSTNFDKVNFRGATIKLSNLNSDTDGIIF